MVRGEPRAATRIGAGAGPSPRAGLRSRVRVIRDRAVGTEPSRQPAPGQGGAGVPGAAPDDGHQFRSDDDARPVTAGERAQPDAAVRGVAGGRRGRSPALSTTGAGSRRRRSQVRTGTERMLATSLWAPCDPRRSRRRSADAVDEGVDRDWLTPRDPRPTPQQSAGWPARPPASPPAARPVIHRPAGSAGTPGRQDGGQAPGTGIGCRPL